MTWECSNSYGNLCEAVPAAMEGRLLVCKNALGFGGLRINGVLTTKGAISYEAQGFCYSWIGKRAYSQGPV